MRWTIRKKLAASSLAMALLAAALGRCGVETKKVSEEPPVPTAAHPARQEI